MTIPVHLGGTPDISWTFGRDFRPLPDNREGLTTTFGHPGDSGPHPNIQEGLMTTPGHPGGTPDISWTSGRDSGPPRTPGRA